MIVEFSIQNFLSFNRKTNLSFIPDALKENEKESVFKTQHKGLKLLKGGAIIGANASGKSNALKAITFMRNLVLKSWHMGATDPIKVEPFKLSHDSLNSASSFEITFLIEDVKYRYGFEVTKSKVEKEWLFFTPKKQEKKYFERLGNLIDTPKEFEEGLKYRSQTRPNSLFLSTVAQHNGKISLLITKWFQDLNIVSDTNYTDTLHDIFTKSRQNSTFKGFLKKIVNIVDLGFDDIEIIPITLDDKILSALPEEVREQVKNNQQLQFKTVHKRYDSSGIPIESIHFDLMKEESQGTIKYIALAGPIVECLSEGKTLLIDELDSRLHPDLIATIIKMFNSKSENPKNAQLIFTTNNHDFLEDKLLRRDQVFSFDKNTRGESSVSKAMILKKVRNDASYKKDYKSGKYGSKPKINLNQLNIFE